MDLDQKITRLERDIKRLQVRFQRFFAGDLDLPPGELRDDIEQRLRELRGDSTLSSVHRFRLTQLEARYNSYNGMFRRRLRQLETTGHPDTPRPGRLPAVDPSYDPEAGIVVGTRRDTRAVAALYDGLRDRQEGSPPMDLDEFRDYIERQTARIQDRTGCTDVEYRLVEQDGQTKLKARPVGPRD